MKMEAAGSSSTSVSAYLSKNQIPEDGFFEEFIKCWPADVKQCPQCGAGAHPEKLHLSTSSLPIQFIKLCFINEPSLIVTNSRKSK
jgi:hypothetical protein